jgi:hypothetical protein
LNVWEKNPPFILLNMIQWTYKKSNCPNDISVDEVQFWRWESCWNLQAEKNFSKICFYVVTSMTS